MRSDMQNAASPAAYLAGLDGWRLKLATSLRRAVKKSAGLDEQLKWGHLVYFSGGPVCLIRVEANRVLFGFWRGKRLREIEPKLKAGGRYELANQVFVKGDEVDSAIAAKLAKAAAALNRKLGNPQAEAKR